METKQTWADTIVTLLARDHTLPFCHAIKARIAEDPAGYTPKTDSFELLSWLVGDRIALAYDTDEPAREVADAIAKEHAFDYDRHIQG